VGDGIAIPHVRNPLVLGVEHTALLLCLLAEPVDYGAVDGRAVDVLFTLVTPNVRAHLQLLGRLSYVLRDVEFRRQLRAGAPAAEILAAVRSLEAQLG
jgi:PTS system nitrogen regulatory IIA component